MPMVRDDLDKAFPAPSMRGGVCPDPEHPLTRAMIARISDDMAGHARGCGSLILFIVLVPIAVIIAFVVAGVAAWATNTGWVGPVVWVLVMIGCTVAIGKLLTPSIDQPLARGLRWLGRCGSCCHPVAGAPSVNGLTRCPECGAAWFTERLRDVHVPDTDAFGARRLRKKLQFLRTPRIRYRDSRNRFINPAFPRMRWIRGTVHEEPLRRLRWIRWGIATALGLFPFVAMGACVYVIVNDERLAGIAILMTFGAVAVTTTISAFVYPLILIRLVRAAGLCAACANPLDEQLCCTACEASWGRRSAHDTANDDQPS